MFKEGDWVVCINANGSRGELLEGAQYEVVQCTSPDYLPLITLALNDNNPWDATRFVLASEYSAAENIKQTTALEVQYGGGHYKGMKIQPVEFIHANNIGYMEGNAIKYLCRWQLKNGLEDLNKAKHYIELLIEMEKGRESKD